MKKYLALVQLSTILVSAAICSVAIADIHYFVQMNVNAQETELEITTPRKDAGGCPLGKKKGCIRANRGDQIKFSFQLTGDAKCTLADGASWKLSEVFLGGKNSSGKPDPNGWGGLSGDAEVTHDFDFADAAKGTLKSLSRSDRQLTFFDKNEHKYEIWYLVTADCVDRNNSVLKTISVDPRVVNEGKL